MTLSREQLERAVNKAVTAFKDVVPELIVEAVEEVLQEDAEANEAATLAAKQEAEDAAPKEKLVPGGFMAEGPKVDTAGMTEEATVPKAGLQDLKPTAAEEPIIMPWDDADIRIFDVEGREVTAAEAPQEPVAEPKAEGDGAPGSESSETPKELVAEAQAPQGGVSAEDRV